MDRLINRILAALGARGRKPEADISYEPARVGKPHGGVPHPDAPDRNSTTGTTPNADFVGRASGDSAGDAGETGAERRSEAARDA